MKRLTSGQSKRSPWMTMLCSSLLFTSLTGCENDPETAAIAIDGIAARTADDIATVVIVEWTTDVATTGRVEFGEGDDFSYSTAMEKAPSTTHRALVLGMPPQTEVRYRVVASDGGSETTSEPRTITTGDVPTSLPDLDARGTGPEGFTIVPVIATGTSVVTIIDSEGRIVWYHVDDRDLDIYRARLSRDRKSILYNAASVSGSPSEESELMRISLDGASIEGIPVPLLAHDFLELDDGTMGAIVAEYRTVGGAEIMGNQIVEVSADGEVTPVWSTFDCFDPETDVGDTTDNGWTFANALDYDPVDDVYYIGFLNLSSIAKVDRKSGRCLWVFGSTAETISFAEGEPTFWHQHQFQVLEDGILIFDNDGAPGTESRVVEYAFDFTSNTASEVWSYTAEPSLFTFVLGEPIRFDNGDTLINWSASGQMNLVTPKGESTYQLNLSMGNVFGFDTFETTLY
jgi:hypothetical protein